MIKKCPMCRKEKDKSEFYITKTRYDRLSSYCKECTKIKQRANKKYFRDYQRKRRKNLNPEGIDRRKNREVKPRDIAKYNREYFRKKYREDNDFRKKRADLDKKRREENPEKDKARSLFRYAVRIGKIVRMPCEVCGKPKADGHHSDYNKPLEVMWLCKKHHAEWHSKNKAIEPVKQLSVLV